MLQLNENKQFAFFQRLAFPLRIFLLILVFSIFVIAALAQYFTASFEDYLTLHVRDMAMNQAKITNGWRPSLTYYKEIPILIMW